MLLAADLSRRKSLDLLSSETELVKRSTAPSGSKSATMNERTSSKPQMLDQCGAVEYESSKMNSCHEPLAFMNTD